MKKYLNYLIILLISCLIFTNKVKADTYQLNYNINDLKLDQLMAPNLYNNLEWINTYMDQTLGQNYYYYIFLEKTTNISSSNPKINLFVYLVEKTDRTALRTRRITTNCGEAFNNECFEGGLIELNQNGSDANFKYSKFEILWQAYNNGTITFQNYNGFTSAIGNDPTNIYNFFENMSHQTIDTTENSRNELAGATITNGFIRIDTSKFIMKENGFFTEQSQTIKAFAGALLYTNNENLILNDSQIYNSNNKNWADTKFNFTNANNDIIKIGQNQAFPSVEMLNTDLKYKASFNSNIETGDDIGKIELEFNYTEQDSILEYGFFKTKFHFYANDYTQENIPIFSHIKIFTKKSGENSQWEEINDFSSQVWFDLPTIETIENKINYMGSVGSGTAIADIDIVLQFNMKKIILSENEEQEFKIEFYFDNTTNATIDIYDSLKNSSWHKTHIFLANYKYVYFPRQYKYAIITDPENKIVNNRVYFPTNSLNNELINLQGQYFNINSKIFSKPIEPGTYTNNYYSYFDYEFNQDEKLFALTRSLGNATTTSFYSKDIDDLLSYVKYMNTGMSLGILDNRYYPTIDWGEDTYFYIPNNLNVYFTNNENLIVETDSGNINLGISDSTNMYEKDPNVNGSKSGLNYLIDNLTKIFNDSDKSIFSIINNVWNKIMSSKIGTYITLLIVGSIIAIIVKALKK